MSDKDATIAQKDVLIEEKSAQLLCNVGWFEIYCLS